MNIFKQEEIDEVAEDSGYLFDTYEAFVAGIAFAESKVEAIAIEFADWINSHKEGFHSLYREKNSVTPIHWATSFMGGRVDYTSKELFEIFLKERNND